MAAVIDETWWTAYERACADGDQTALENMLFEVGPNPLADRRGRDGLTAAVYGGHTLSAATIVMVCTLGEEMRYVLEPMGHLRFYLDFWDRFEPVVDRRHGLWPFDPSSPPMARYVDELCEDDAIFRSVAPTLVRWRVIDPLTGAVCHRYNILAYIEACRDAILWDD